MNVLFYGAGVIGSLYAARLCQAGHKISVLARGQRLADIHKHGIVLEHAMTKQRTAVRVNTVARLAADDAYDVVVVVVRKDQASAMLQSLAANTGTPNILFMINNPSGYDEWAGAVGRERLLLGFPGAGGTREGHVVRYVIAPRLLQPTTFGEWGRRITPRLKAVVRTFKQSGFPVAISRNMDAWQKTHVALVSPLANAIYMAEGQNCTLIELPQAIRLVARAIREGFQVLRALGVPITPPKLKAWEWAPESILVALLRCWANTAQFEIMAVHHARAARGEMKQLADEFKALAGKTSVPTPAMEELNLSISSRQAQ